jgi:hypothetical protein
MVTVCQAQQSSGGGSSKVREGNSSDGIRRRLLTASALLVALIAIAPVQPTAASPNSVYFAATGYNLSTPLLGYWQEHGDLPIFGYPISQAFQTTDGSTVQYFERSALVVSPQGPISVALLGTALTQGQSFPQVKSFSNSSKHVYFKQTGHSLNNRFLAYWKANGGLAQFGYPISEPTDVGSHGIIQWFERARFEWDDRNPDVVTLGLLGHEYVAKHPLSGAATTPAPKPAAAQKQTSASSAPGKSANPSPPAGAGYAKWQALPGADKLHWYGWSTYFSTDWNELIRLNESWGNLPKGYKGTGMYAAIPEDTTEQWHLYGHKVRISYGGKSVDAQLIDVIAYRDIPGVRKRGVVVDLSPQVFDQFAPLSKGMLQVNVQVLP